MVGDSQALLTDARKNRCECQLGCRVAGIHGLTHNGSPCLLVDVFQEASGKNDSELKRTRSSTRQRQPEIESRGKHAHTSCGHRTRAGEYLRNGRPALIDGRLQSDQWEDKETGLKRSKLKVVGESLQLLGGRNDGQSNGSSPAASPSSGASAAADGAYDNACAGSPADEEVPF